MNQIPIIKAVMQFAQRLRFSQLFFLTAGLFLLDLIIPDLIPFVDELLLGLLTLLFGTWRKSTGKKTSELTAEKKIN